MGGVGEKRSANLSTRKETKNVCGKANKVRNSKTNQERPYEQLLHNCLCEFCKSNLHLHLVILVHSQV